MVSDRSSEIKTTLDRILRERLEQFKVPPEIRNEVRKEILAFFQRPENVPYGACFMTPEASMAADEARIAKKETPGSETPKVV